MTTQPPDPSQAKEYQPHREGLHSDDSPYPGEKMCYCDKPDPSQAELDAVLDAIFFSSNLAKQEAKSVLTAWSERSAKRSNRELLEFLKANGHGGGNWRRLIDVKLTALEEKQ